MIDEFHCGSDYFLIPVQELYHELHALDRFDQDYKRKLQEEENSTPAQRGKPVLRVYIL